MGYKHTSMISPAMFREFMLPRYKRLAQFVEEIGIPVLLLDCDGHVSQLIPLWIEAGIFGTFPTELAAGNNPVAYRKQYGNKMAIFGGIDKRAIRSKEQTYEEVMSRVPWLIEQGGFLPSIDHAVPPDVHLRGYLICVNLSKPSSKVAQYPCRMTIWKLRKALGLSNGCGPMSLRVNRITR
ncbi:hypothetical protein H8E77_03840 [bacterium]|nr:hypothetical protein [bacterium]